MKGGTIVIYKTIQEIAQKRGVSVRKIETELNFSNGTIHKWETAQTLPLGKIKAVANYLNVDPYTLLLVGVDMSKVKVGDQHDTSA